MRCLRFGGNESLLTAFVAKLRSNIMANAKNQSFAEIVEVVVVVVERTD